MVSWKFFGFETRNPLKNRMTHSGHPRVVHFWSRPRWKYNLNTCWCYTWCALIGLTFDRRRNYCSLLEKNYFQSNWLVRLKDTALYLDAPFDAKINHLTPSRKNCTKQMFSSMKIQFKHMLCTWCALIVWHLTEDGIL